MDGQTLAWIVLLCIAAVHADGDPAQDDCPTITGEVVGDVSSFSPKSSEQMIPEGKEEVAMFMLLRDVQGFESFMGKTSAYYVPEEVHPTASCPLDGDALSRLVENWQSGELQHGTEKGRKLLIPVNKRPKRKKHCFCINPCKLFDHLDCDDDGKHCMCD